MFPFIENLRNKSDKEKKTIVLGASTLITAFIFLVWLSVMIPKSSTEVVAVAKEPEQTQADVTENTEKQGPIETFKRGVAQVFESVQNEFGTVKDSLKLNIDKTIVPQNTTDESVVELKPINER
jgi:hypothetical protein